MTDVNLGTVSASITLDLSGLTNAKRQAAQTLGQVGQALDATADKGKEAAATISSAYQDAAGRLRDARGRFVSDLGGMGKAGQDAGEQIKQGAEKGEKAMERMSRSQAISVLRHNIDEMARTAQMAFDKVIKKSFDAASNLNESLSKSQVVFKAHAKEVETWSKTSATAMGQSQQAAIEATATFGNLFTAMRIGEAQSAKMSMRLVQLASDLASFNNVSPEEALVALRAGLVGETEPLRRFGVNLNEATIKAQAFKMHLTASTKEALDPATKAAAAYNLILQQTTTAQGDFGRTANGAANQQRILKAEFENAAAALGQQLLPYGTQLLQQLIKITDAFTKLPKETQQGITEFVLGAGAFVVVTGNVVRLIARIGELKLALDTLGASKGLALLGRFGPYGAAAAVGVGVVGAAYQFGGGAEADRLNKQEQQNYKDSPEIQKITNAIPTLRERQALLAKKGRNYRPAGREGMVADQEMQRALAMAGLSGNATAAEIEDAIGQLQSRKSAALAKHQEDIRNGDSDKIASSWNAMIAGRAGFGKNQDPNADAEWQQAIQEAERLAKQGSVEDARAAFNQALEVFRRSAYTMDSQKRVKEAQRLRRLADAVQAAEHATNQTVLDTTPKIGGKVSPAAIARRNRDNKQSDNTRAAQGQDIDEALSDAHNRAATQANSKSAAAASALKSGWKGALDAQFRADQAAFTDNFETPFKRIEALAKRGDISRQTAIRALVLLLRRMEAQGWTDNDLYEQIQNKLDELDAPMVQRRDTFGRWQPKWATPEEAAASAAAYDQQNQMPPSTDGYNTPPDQGEVDVRPGQNGNPEGRRISAWRDRAAAQDQLRELQTTFDDIKGDPFAFLSESMAQNVDMAKISFRSLKDFTTTTLNEIQSIFAKVMAQMAAKWAEMQLLKSGFSLGWAGALGGGLGLFTEALLGGGRSVSVPTYNQPGASRAVTVNFHGPVHVRNDQDIPALASQMAQHLNWESQVRGTR